MEKSISAKKWKSLTPPIRILVIRFYALGDLVITLPYIQGLKKILPDSSIDLLTTDELTGLCESIELFDRVIPIAYERKTRKLALNGFLSIPKLRSAHYDVVIDLQNNWISRSIRKWMNARAWSEFDRFSPIPAGMRVAHTINALEMGEVKIYNSFTFNNLSGSCELLRAHGWTGGNLVVLNPAGFFETRNWPLANYVTFARLWLQKSDKTQFMILGIDRIKSKAAELEQQLGGALINLVGKTTSAEAFSLIQFAEFVLSEDSGLMHMAWVSGIPTVALFGSSRSDWSRPIGAHTLCLNSADMACGECMQATCKFGDVRCLSRFSPEEVFGQSMVLLNKRDR